MICSISDKTPVWREIVLKYQRRDLKGSAYSIEIISHGDSKHYNFQLSKSQSGN